MNNDKPQKSASPRPRKIAAVSEKATKHAAELTPTAPSVMPEADVSRLKTEVGDAIDRSVFDDEPLAPEEYKVQTSAIDVGILSKDRLKSRTRTKILKTTDAFISKAERFYPSIEEGLTQDQVNRRVEEGLFNYTDVKNGKTYLNIFLSNIFTFFNMLTFAVAIALIVFQSGIEKLFFMLIVLLNIAIGIFQEIRSKRTVDKLKLVTAPTATVVRNGEKVTIPVSEIVLDDIMYV